MLLRCVRVFGVVFVLCWVILIGALDCIAVQYSVVYCDVLYCVVFCVVIMCVMLIAVVSAIAIAVFVVV